MTALADASPEIAMIEHLKTLTGSVKVVWPNTAPYSPVIGTAYYRVAFLPIPSERLTLGNADRHSGILQVDIVVPSKAGLFTALNMARAVAQHYDRQTLVENSVKVRIIKAPSLGPHLQDPDWYTIPVSITYETLN